MLDALSLSHSLGIGRVIASGLRLSETCLRKFIVCLNVLTQLILSTYYPLHIRRRKTFGFLTKFGKGSENFAGAYGSSLRQGGIIPSKLTTRLTQNLKTSHEIFVGSPALCCENKLLAKYHRNKVTFSRIKFLSQEMK
jgi:hypothetical protein